MIIAGFYITFALISIMPLFINALFPTIFHDLEERSLEMGVGIFTGAFFYHQSPCHSAQYMLFHPLGSPIDLDLVRSRSR